MPANRPTLATWMQNAAAGHPLHRFLAAPEPYVASWLDVLESMLALFEAAAPQRWETKRSEFRSLRTEQGFLEWRAELVVAIKLIKAHEVFVFGDRKQSNPDMVLSRMSIGLEVTGKTPEGVLHLYDEIEEALQPWPQASAHLAFSSYPIRVQAPARSDLARRVAEAAAASGGAFRYDVDDPKNGQAISIDVQILPVPSLGRGFRVTWETVNPELATPLDAVEYGLIEIASDPAKRRQAGRMPTLLVVDVSRIGPAWMRPAPVWAQMLRSRLPHDFPFIGLAVINPKLEFEDTEIGLAVSPGAIQGHLDAIGDFADALGLEPV